jgi:hypothetical protein
MGEIERPPGGKSGGLDEGGGQPASAFNSSTHCNCTSDAAYAFLNALIVAALEDDGRYGVTAARAVPWWTEHWLQLRRVRP